MEAKLGDGLRALSGVVLLAAIVGAPWMYGCTRHAAILVLCWWLSAASACWLLSRCLLSRSAPLPRAVIVCVCFLIVAGWLSVLSGPGLPEDAFAAAHFAELARRWPGSFILKSPVETMWLSTGLLIAMVASVDLGADRRWLCAFGTVIAVTGASIVVLGIVQIKTGAQAIFWERDVPFTGFFFGTFFHHSIAGAFINLAWPLAAGPFVTAALSSAAGWRRRGSLGFWGLVLGLGWCGPLAQVSKFSQAIAVVLAVLIGGWAIWNSDRRWWALVRLILLGVLVAVGVVAMALETGKLDFIAQRWRALSPPLQPASPGQNFAADWRMRGDGFIAPRPDDPSGSSSDREASARTCLRMIPRAGLIGFGPGTWKSVYPHFTNDVFLRTFFLYVQFAHEDYLQTLVEWGMLGGAAWAVLWFGGLGNGIAKLRAARRNPWTSELGILAGACVALVGVFLQAVIDFPLQIPSIQLYVAVLVGLLWSRRPEKESASAAPPA